MFSQSFILFGNYLVLLHGGLLNTQINVIKNIVIIFLRVPDVILLGLKIPIDQNYTHSRNTTNMIIKWFNFDNFHIRIETPERTTQKSFICTTLMLLEYEELCKNVLTHKPGNSHPNLHSITQFLLGCGFQYLLRTYPASLYSVPLQDYQELLFRIKLK